MAAIAKLLAAEQPPLQLKPALPHKDCPTIAVHNQVADATTQNVEMQPHQGLRQGDVRVPLFAEALR